MSLSKAAKAQMVKHINSFKRRHAKYVANYTSSAAVMQPVLDDIDHHRASDDIDEQTKGHLGDLRENILRHQSIHDTEREDADREYGLRIQQLMDIRDGNDFPPDPLITSTNPRGIRSQYIKLADDCISFIEEAIAVFAEAMPKYTSDMWCYIDRPQLFLLEKLDQKDAKIEYLKTRNQKLEDYHEWNPDVMDSLEQDVKDACVKIESLEGKNSELQRKIDCLEKQITERQHKIDGDDGPNGKEPQLDTRAKKRKACDESGPERPSKNRRIDSSSVPSAKAHTLTSRKSRPTHSFTSGNQRNPLEKIEGLNPSSSEVNKSPEQGMMASSTDYALQDANFSDQSTQIITQKNGAVRNETQRLDWVQWLDLNARYIAVASADCCNLWPHHHPVAEFWIPDRKIAGRYFAAASGRYTSLEVWEKVLGTKVSFPEGLPEVKIDTETILGVFGDYLDEIPPKAQPDQSPDTQSDESNGTWEVRPPVAYDVLKKKVAKWRDESLAENWLYYEPMQTFIDFGPSDVPRVPRVEK